MQVQKPRSVRDVFEQSFLLYRRRFRFLIGTAVAILFPYYIASAYVRTHFLLTDDQADQIVQDMEQKGDVWSALSTVVSVRTEVWMFVLSAVFMLLVLPILYGMIAQMSSKSLQHGQETTIADAGNAAFRRLFPNMATLLLAIVIYLVLAVCYMELLSLVTYYLGAALGVLATVIAILGTLGFIVGVVVYFIRFSFLPAIVVVEGLSFFRAMARSWRLTKSRSGQLLGFYVMLSIVCFVAQVFMTLIGDMFFQSAGTQLLIAAIIGMLVMPFALTCMSTMFVELQSRDRNPMR
ncbi:hypothetical protein AAC03nite_01950 [Alicyclobacillus acidoterrestris]|uniref:hypothetical protein n=1 Tax=Alicyclobacillus suci TaxID=2816080 RepID=UPI00118F1F1A|nr:hypothetical protein [Alicyclobacillus suci]GEO24410.1 hypothetical protein AAC03nite_01950 [Alicyclobacillus acidoterrestris]